ncbi:MAG: TraR/DksA C4-type zinc finger protein [Bryobacterales bacterium]|nr:TraR/DksA C4-type zinc finger protein [Bryobacterales bacterium]
MKKTDVDHYRTLLTAKRKEIMTQSNRREDLWIVQTNEQIEAVQLSGLREFAARALELDAKSRSQIDAAIKRIDDGEFGICLDCDEQISSKRLAAVPWAAYCLHCQELRDAGNAPHAFEPKLAA